MKFSSIGTLAITASLVIPITAHSFEDGDVIAFDPGECIGVNCMGAGFGHVEEGSYFELFGDPTFRIPLTPGPNGGMIVGTTQSAPGIDSPWSFFGQYGMHATITPITQNADGTLDFSGLRAYWNGEELNLGLGAAATVDCGGASICDANNQYTIEYSTIIRGGPFSGIPYRLHLEHQDSLPGINVSISVFNGTMQECASTGGNEVSGEANIALLNGAELGDITWSIDGNPLGNGSNFNTFLPVGEHSLSVIATTTTGQEDTASISVTIRDFTRPVVETSFVDNRTGNVITSIDTKNTAFVKVKINAADVCDASPHLYSVGGFALKDGDLLKIQGNLDKVELTTSQLTLYVTANDASGNQGSAYKTLNITP